MNEREQQIQKARELLSDQQLIDFFRVAGLLGGTLAVAGINRSLDEGQDLDAVFYTERDFGYSLHVIKLGPSLFRILFGYQADPLAGDGGSWEVTFDGDAVETIGRGRIWTS